MNIGQLIIENKLKLENGKIDEAQLESELIIMHILNLNKTNLLLNLNTKITNQQIKENNLIIKKRLKRIPLAYILNYKYFYKSKFYTDESVLIPRQETEILVEICSNLIKNEIGSFKILEVGIGSGAITGSLANLFQSKNIEYIATDININSLHVAKMNVLKLNKSAKLNLVHNDLLKGVKGSYKFVISNPPYLSIDEMKNIKTELKFEPKEALHGGTEGHEVCENILIQLAESTVEFENLILEINPTHSQYLLKIIKKLFQNYFKYVIKDYNKQNRFILITQKEVSQYLNKFNYCPNWKNLPSVFIDGATIISALCMSLIE